MLHSRRRRAVAVVAVLLAAAAAGAGQLAFTAGNSLPSTTGGYGSTDVTGATATSITYTTNPTGQSLTGANITMTGNMSGKLIRAGFDSDPLSMCQVGPFNGTSTQVTCNGYGHTTSGALAFHVVVTDGNGSPGGGYGGSGGGSGPAMLMCDSFVGPDGSSLDGRALSCGAGTGTWTASPRGPWSIENNQAVPGNGEGASRWATVPFGPRDAVAEVTVSNLDTYCGSGLVLNVNPDTSALAVYVNSGGGLTVASLETDLLFGFPQPAQPLLYQGSVTTAGAYNLRVKRANDKLYVMVNDTPITTVNLSAEQVAMYPSGYFGMYTCSFGARFDDFKVSVPPAP
jgi:hypothetical protein